MIKIFKKQFFIVFLTLIVGGSAEAETALKQATFWRPAFQKQLKRVETLPSGGFKSQGLKRRLQKKTKFPVSINWKTLYWGKLSDLLYEPQTSEEEAQGSWVANWEKNGCSISLADTEETRNFAREIRRELKAFARVYNLKIVWRGTSKGVSEGIEDVTSAFLEFWDRGLSAQGGEGLPSLAELTKIPRVNEASEITPYLTGERRGVDKAPGFLSTKSRWWRFLKKASLTLKGGEYP